jgi:hypothetical protein
MTNYYTYTIILQYPVAHHLVGTVTDIVKHHTTRVYQYGYYQVLKFFYGRSSSYFQFIVGIYKTVILPVVVYGCETWSLTVREEHKLRVFENSVLWKIFGPKRDEVTEGWI